MLNRTLICTLMLACATCVAEGTDGELMARVADRPSGGAQQTASRSEDSQPGEKKLSGMSILGNQEAPKALVIVPWKSSKIGDSLGLSESFDDSRQPVDKEVFMRELAYYEIRSQ